MTLADAQRQNTTNRMMVRIEGHAEASAGRASSDDE